MESDSSLKTDSSPASNRSEEPKPLRILSVEDDEMDDLLLRERLKQDGLRFEMARVYSEADFLKALDSSRFDLIISDFSMPGFSGREALLLAQARCPEVPFIFFSGTIGEERAVDCLRNGAVDFLLKDSPARLGSAVRRAVAEASHERELDAARGALRTTQAQFLALLEQSIIGVYLIRDGCWSYVNSRIEQMLGYGRGEINGLPVMTLIAPEDRPRAQHNIQRRLSGEVGSVHYELRMLHKTGALVEVDAHGSVTQIDGRPAILGVMLDITEKNRAEAKNREQAAWLDKSLNAILVRDLSGVIRYWNEGAGRLYGWKAEEAVGRFADELLLPPGKSDTSEAAQKTVATGEWNGELTHRAGDGREVFVESHWTLMRHEDGSPKSILVVNHDATEKRRIDDQMRRTQRMDSLGALAGGIAHDLNNALAPIMMSLSLLRDQVHEESGRSMIEVLELSCQRGTDMVKQILLFARGSEGDKMPVRLNRLLTDLAKMLKQTFPRTISVELRLHESLKPVLGDATQLHQVFMNLCVNARDAMPQGGLLRIESSNTTIDALAASMYGEVRPGAYVFVTVADTGGGMPPEVIEKIFEPFFTTKEVGKGTGLGLSTVLGIVKGMGGFVKVYSEPGRGSSFQIYLPAQTASSANDYLSPDELPQGMGQTILLVDDEAPLLQITAATLMKNGYRVLTAPDGAQALAIYAERRQQIDVVITDMTMPIMDGPAVIQVLKRLNPDVKIIAVSGLMMDLKAAQVDPAYGVQFLAKPFDIGKLLLTLRKILPAESAATLGTR